VPAVVVVPQVGKSVFSYKGFFVRVTLRRASNSRPNQPSQAGLKFNTALTTTVDFYLDSGVSDFLVKRCVAKQPYHTALQEGL
jgi:hypothetical protein